MTTFPGEVRSEKTRPNARFLNGLGRNSIAVRAGQREMGSGNCSASRRFGT
jgi:hypothetical protein